MEYVETYASRAGFVFPRDGKILRAHLVRFIQCCNMWLGHEDGISWERVNGNVGNTIELVMKIPTIKSQILQVS
jgi:hypothetical protein